MNKLSKLVLVMTGLMVVFYISGLISSSPNSTLLNLLLNPENLQNSGLAAKFILAIETASIVGAVIYGFVFRNIELIASTIFTTYLFNLAWDFLAVVVKVASVSKILALLLFSPLLVVYIITAFEFWRGRD